MYGRSQPHAPGYFASVADSTRHFPIASRIDRAIPSLGWPGEVLGSIDADRKAVAAANDDASRVAALHKLLDKLDLAQRRALLAKVIETRKTQ